MSAALALCYHAVSPGWTADLSVRPEAFRAQLRDLDRRGYRGVTFAEAVLAPASHRRVAVTFDDAFTSVATLAKPILDELGWPATVFAVTDYAARGTPLAWDAVAHWAATDHAGELDSLDWDALRGLRDAGWEVGSHTVSHPHLTRLSDAELAGELAASRAIVEAEMGGPCPSIAYPFGDCDARVAAAAGAAGYLAGAGLPARWPRTTPLEYPRVGVYFPDDLRRFRVKASALVHRLRRRLGR